MDAIDTRFSIIWMLMDFVSLRPPDGGTGFANA